MLICTWSMYMTNTPTLCNMLVFWVLWLSFRRCSDIFVTSAKEDIRIWNTITGQELLRISVPNMSCTALNVTDDGKAILSGTKSIAAQHVYE